MAMQQQQLADDSTVVDLYLRAQFAPRGAVRGSGRAYGAVTREDLRGVAALAMLEALRVAQQKGREVQPGFLVTVGRRRAISALRSETWRVRLFVAEDDPAQNARSPHDIEVVDHNRHLRDCVSILEKALSPADLEMLAAHATGTEAVPAKKSAGRSTHYYKLSRAKQAARQALENVR